MIYVFNARYENMDIDDEESIIIKVDSQWAKCEKEVYMEAMSMAYDVQTESMSLQALLLIGVER